MRVGSTGPVIHRTGQSRKFTGQTCLDMYLGRLDGPWLLLLFPRYVVLSDLFTGIVCSIYARVHAKNDKDRNPHICT